MSTKIYANARFGLREDTLVNWMKNNPVLEKGEPAVVRDGVNGEWLKIGDGMTAFNDLPWKFSGSVGQKTTEGGEVFNDYEDNIATGEDSHSEGGKTEATGAFAHAQNRKAKATGRHSHAQNYDTLAKGEASSASGVQSKVFQRGGYVEGIQCISGDETQDSSVDNPAHSEGIHSKSIGFASHAENSSEALGDQSHSENMSKVSGTLSHGEGSAVVDGDYAHGEGGAIVKGDFAHGEGDGTEAEGYAAHSQGQNTKAKGQASNAGGERSEANHRCSDAVGYYLQTGAHFQAVRGKYNKISEDALFIVGNGTSGNDRKNAFEVKADGSAVLQKQGDTDNSLALKSYVDNAIAIHESKQKNYEHIATIKVTPDENGDLPTSIVFTQDDNGKPFELTDFYLSMVLGATDGSAARVRLDINDKMVFGNTPISLNTSLRSWYINYMDLGSGKLCIAPSTSIGITYHTTTGNANYTGFAGAILSPIFEGYSPVTKIKFQNSAGTTKTFIEGSEFKLYGVRK